MTDDQSSAPWRAGLHSARALFWPGLLLQGTAVSLVLAYYFVPATQPAFALVGRWQHEGGFAFSAVSTAICGGLLPFIFLRLQSVTRPTHPWPHLVFFMLFWAYKGIEVDLWYRVMAHWFGADNTPRTIVSKMLCDQLGYNIVWATPVTVLGFAWKAAGWRLTPILDDVRAGRWYARRVVPALIAMWCVWVPVTACVYSLPVALQMPLFNVGLCFWSLLFAYMVAHDKR